MNINQIDSIFNEIISDVKYLRLKSIIIKSCSKEK